MEIERLRKQMERLDKQIVRLLGERTELAKKIGKLKMEKGMEVYSPVREEEVYRRIVALTKDKIPRKAILSIYREIMSLALSVQKKIVVAYLGPEATFTHEAACLKFGMSVDYLSRENIADVFKAVETGYADYGVVPIENSIEGAVTYTLDMFMDSPLKICSEIVVEISHNLLSRERDIRKIKKVYSNPQVFGQCRNWIRENLGNVELIEVSSTANASIRASKEKGAAAIASKLAGELYRLHILAEDIEDIKHNITRFLVIGNKSPSPTGNDKTSILFSIKDRVGALYDALRVFKDNNINLTKIESRPSKKKVWDYYFFVDFMGHCAKRNVKRALKDLRKECVFVKILGSYPRAN